MLESVVLFTVRRFRAARGLELSEKKTRIIHFTEGFDFLGQNVHRYDHQCLTEPAKKSINSLLAKVREIIRGYATATQAGLVGPSTISTPQHKQPLTESTTSSSTCS